MRWVFVAIVALNLLYLGWKLLDAGDRAAPEDVVRAEAGQFPAGLELLSERAAPSSEPPVVAPVTPVTGCPAIGPFAEKDVAPVVDALDAAGFEAAGVAVERDAMPVFWVYIPPAASRQQALRQLRELHAKGIDSFVVTSGTDQHAISLGSFGSRDSAVGVQARLRAAGYTAEIRQQVRDVRQSWVVLVDPAAQGFFEFVPPALQSSARLERQACPRAR